MIATTFLKRDERSLPGLICIKVCYPAIFFQRRTEFFYCNNCNYTNGAGNGFLIATEYTYDMRRLILFILLHIVQMEFIAAGCIILCKITANEI